MKILFVCDLFNPESTKSSTQLLIYSAIKATVSAGNEVFVFGVCQDFSDQTEIKKYFIEMGCKKVDTISAQEQESKRYNKVAYFIKIYKSFLCNNKRISNIIKKFSENLMMDKIVCFIPSTECFNYAQHFSHLLKVKVVTIWTDVLAYNTLDSLKKISFKRKLLIPLEKEIISKSTMNYYLGKTQCNFQKTAYPKLKSKMSFYYPSYINRNKNIAKHKFSGRCVGYYGNFSENMRNIEPLINTASSFPNMFFYLEGTGRNTVYCNHKNVYIKKIKRNENANYADKITNSFDVILVFLNKHGFSLPGKLFYDTDYKKPILVIKDGPFKDSIEEELSVSERFVFAENNIDSIYEALKKIEKNDFLSGIEKNEFFNPVNCYSFIWKDKENE